jgi:hypothetical protein
VFSQDLRIHKRHATEAGLNNPYQKSFRNLLGKARKGSFTESGSVSQACQNLRVFGGALPNHSLRMFPKIFPA